MKDIYILEEFIMHVEKRSYRKNLASHGLIYLANEELEISVKNLSITGLLAELDANVVIKGVDDIFHAISTSATIDLYLPEMRLAGEADVVRAEKIDGRIFIAMEFRNLSYEINNLLYKRKAYRKSLTASGQIQFNQQSYAFLTHNVSVDGLMIHLKEKLDVEVGMVTSFDYPRLDIKGEVKVVWVEHGGDGTTLLGLQYVRLIKGPIKGIAGFLSNHKIERI